MPRPTKMSESPAPAAFQDIYDASPAPSGLRRQTRPNISSLSPSPGASASASSDKENRSARTVNGEKDRRRAPMAPPRRPSPGTKRKRGQDETSRATSQRRRIIETEEPDDNDGEDNYDPDQDIEERRVLRKELRFLSKELMDNRSEYLKPTSKGLLETLQKANDLSASVKQTADATIDSRLLVNAADLSYRKTLALTTGDISQGVDVDEFVSKCITFMKRARGSERIQQTQTQTQTQSSTQRRRRANVDDGSDGEGDEGDMLNWEHLGRFACLPNNSRPSVPGFLLGPLSQEKRARKVAARKAAFRPDKSQETRPEVLEAADIVQSHDTNLTLLCQRILGSLKKTLQRAMKAAQEEASDEMTNEDQDALLDRHGISRDEEVSFFKFVINPRSFGQTVENMFYVSFLIRDGKVGIKIDERGLPFLGIIDSGDKNERSDNGAQKHQAILAIDMESWETLIEIFDIKESMIPHREEVVQTTIGARGWYN